MSTPKWTVTKTWQIQSHDQPKNLLKALRERGIVKGNRLAIETRAPGQHRVVDKQGKVQCYVQPDTIQYPSDLAIQNFGVASSYGAMYELRLRLLASKTPALKKYARARNLEDLENAVFEHFEAHIVGQERELLTEGRRLRNKLFHGEFLQAAEKVTLLNPEADVKMGGVFQATIDGAGDIEETGGNPDDMFGNLLAAQQGLLGHAIEVFEKMNGVMKRLVLLA